MKFKTELTSPRQHPAYIAWKKINPAHKEPEKIEFLTQKDGKPHNKKSRIYRLSGSGINGSPVIAKNAPVHTLTNEKFIYEKILPRLPVPSLHFYGFAADDDKNAWIFMEEGGGKNYSEDKEADRTLAAMWLGLLHSITGRLDSNDRPKEHGLGHYFEYIKSGRIELSANLDNTYIKGTDTAVLKEIIHNFGIVESRWGLIVRLCEQMPECVVHRDFIKKNVTIEDTERGRRMNVFDWEYAGWGVPAEDLGALDFTYGNINGRDVISYRKAIHEYWPEVDNATIKQWIYLGLIFRYLAWISTTVKGLTSDWVVQPVDDLRDYNSRLTMVLNKLQWI